MAKLNSPWREMAALDISLSKMASKCSFTNVNCAFSNIFSSILRHSPIWGKRLKVLSVMGACSFITAVLMPVVTQAGDDGRLDISLGAHEVSSLGYGQALFESMTKSALHGLMPLEIQRWRNLDNGVDNSEFYTDMYRADLQFRFGLYSRAEQEFHRLGAGSGIQSHELWQRLGELLYRDGRYEQSLSMLQRINTKSRSTNAQFLIQDIKIRQDQPLSSTALNSLQNKSEYFYLRYRQLLNNSESLSQTEKTNLWQTFFSELDQHIQVTRDHDEIDILDYLMNRAQLSGVLLDLPLDPEMSNTHHLAPLILASLNQTVPDQKAFIVGDLNGHRQAFLSITHGSNVSHQDLFEQYGDLHGEIVTDLVSQPKSKDTFEQWFLGQLQESDFEPTHFTTHWMPWFGEEQIRRELAQVRTLNAIEQSMELWLWRFPFLEFVLQQQEQFYSNAAENIDLTEYRHRLSKQLHGSSQLESMADKAYPIDQGGLLLQDDQQEYMNQITLNHERLIALLEAGLIDDKRYQEKRALLDRAKGRILWDANTQWPDRYRQVSKSMKEIQFGTVQAAQSIDRIKVGSKQWQGENYRARLNTLAKGLTALQDNIDSQRQNALDTLTASGWAQFNEFKESTIHLQQKSLQNKLVYAELLLSKELPGVSRRMVVEEYQQLLEGPLPRQDRQAALLGLAEHLFMLGEEDLQSYQLASERYQQWIADVNSENAREQARLEFVLYRVAQIYALMAEQEQSVATLQRLLTEFPQGQYSDEALFRLGEDAYANSTYEQAVTYYRKQVQDWPDSNLTLKSQYMLGWCHFKLGRLDQSLDHFLTVLEGEVETQSEAKSEAQNQGISSLQDDSTRIAKLVMERAGGAEMLAQKFAAPLMDRGLKAFTLYFDVLRSKELYFKLYESVELFQQQYTNHPSSPQLASDTIELLDRHQFFDAKRQQQALYLDRYVARYLSGDRPAKIQANGLEYAKSLGNHFRGAALKAKGVAQRPLFLKAVDYYQLALTLWPESSTSIVTNTKGTAIPLEASLVTHYFSLADTYFDLKDFRASELLYQKLAYHNVTSDLKPKLNIKAGVAHIASLKQLHSLKPEAYASVLQEGRSLFIESFSAHAMVPGLRLEAADHELQRQQWDSALEFLEPLYRELIRASLQDKVGNASSLPTSKAKFNFSLVDLYTTALYNSNQMIDAANAYSLGLGMSTDGQLHLDGENRQKWLTRLGDARFAAAQTHVEAKDFTSAIQQLNFLLIQVPQHHLAPAAAFDRGDFHQSLNQVKLAQQSWEGLLSNYPNSNLAGKTALRLATLFENQGQFNNAASSLLRYQNGIAVEEALYNELTFKVAELYEKSGDTSDAIMQYKRLSNDASTDQGDWFQASAQLIALYGVQGNAVNANFWRTKVISRGVPVFGQLSVQGQTTVLNASENIASQAAERFKALPLQPPFAQTLPKKQKALAEAIDAYESLAAFAVSPFYEQSLHQLGGLYLGFATDLIDSERPDGLSPLALEEYEIMLEEQAFEFEELGLEYLEQNVERLWGGEQNQFTLESLILLQDVLSSVYKRTEKLEPIHVSPY